MNKETVSKSIIFKPPFEIESRPRIFLAGSIEMGTAEDWQSRVERELEDFNVDIYNPRRDDWDSSWTQTIENQQFHDQVTWELEALEVADFILMYFDPSTKSPISLLELGLFARSNKLIVVCPDGFWRKGNVDVVCHHYGVLQLESLNMALEYLTQTLKGEI